MHLPLGGARQASTRCTPAIEVALSEYIEENRTYTLREMRDLIVFDFGARLSTSTISRKMLKKTVHIQAGKIVSMSENDLDSVY